METIKIWQQDFNKYLVASLLIFGILILSSCSQQQGPAPEARTNFDFDKVSIADVIAGELTKNDKIYKSSYADYYNLDLKYVKEGTEVILLLESEDFLPHLYLLDAKTGKVIAESGQEKRRLVKTQSVGRATSLNFKFNANARYQLITTSLTKAIGRYQFVLCTGWVRNNHDSGFGSLRSAVANAWGIGAICFDNRVFYDDASKASKTITLESEIVIDKKVYIHGPGVDAAIVSGGNSTRIFKVPANNRVTIENLTITKGQANSGEGGAIWNQGSLAMKDSVISESNAATGGGIYNVGSNDARGDLVLENTVVKNNIAANGGGLHNDFASLTLKASSVVVNNTATSGGGIYNGSLSELTMQDRGSVTGNTADFGGGLFNDGTLTLKDYSSIVSNVANTWGGGVYNNAGTLTMQNLGIISGNRAADGGGIYNSFGLPLNGVNLGVNVIGNQPNNLAP